MAVRSSGLCDKFRHCCSTRPTIVGILTDKAEKGVRAEYVNKLLSGKDSVLRGCCILGRDRRTLFNITRRRFYSVGCSVL